MNSVSVHPELTNSAIAKTIDNVHLDPYNRMSKVSNLQIDQGQDKCHNYEDSKVYRILLFVFPCLLAYCFIIMSFLILATYHLKDKKSIEAAEYTISYVRDNLNAPTIQDIQLSISGSCSPQTQPMSLGLWSGIKKGCICSDQKEHNIFMCFLNFWDCSLVSAQPEQQIYNWDSGLSLCQRLTKVQQIDLQCASSTQQQCFPDMCIDTIESCPYNQLLKFTTTQSQDLWQSLPSTQQSCPRQTSFDFEDKFLTLAYNEQKRADIQNTPIIAFQISNGQAPCLNPRISPKKWSGLQYPLDQLEQKGCDSYGDLSNYVDIIDDTKIQELYSVNPEIKNGIQNIAFYGTSYSTRDSVYLMAVRRIYINPRLECINVQKNDLQKFHEFSQLTTPLLVFYTWIIFFVSVFQIFIGVYYAMASSHQRLVKFQWEIERNEKIYFLISFLLVFLGLIQSVFYYIVFTLNLNSLILQMQQYLKDLCFQDEGIVLALKHLISHNKETQNLYSQPAYFYSYVAVLYVIAFFVVQSIQKIKQKQNLLEFYQQ